jgi:hypothetical protein
MPQIDSFARESDAIKTRAENDVIALFQRYLVGVRPGGRVTG